LASRIGVRFALVDTPPPRAGRLPQMTRASAPPVELARGRRLQPVAPDVATTTAFQPA
jgi:hypothetical protein